jgi:hypothetical protein
MDEDRFESEFVIEQNDYPINTGEIFENEFNHWMAPEDSNLTTYSRSIAEDLIKIIKRLLVEYSHPSQSHSKDEEYNKYLQNKKNALYSGPQASHPNPFHLDYFVLGLSKPREEYEKPVFHFNGEYHYMYELRQPLLIPYSALKRNQFEMLFAFSLRQCNLSEWDSFFEYHLEKSFNSELKPFIKLVVLIKRKFESTLFNKGQIEAISEWIGFNEKVSNQKKIKTVLTVDQLAYLFKALRDTNIIIETNNSVIISWLSEAFESKIQSQISERSLNNKFYTPTHEASEFWQDQFQKLLDYTKGKKEK